MKKLAYSFLILLLLIIPFVSADLISPGFKYVQIENKIINMADFKDYNLISYCENIGMAPIQIIKEDGIILGGYKLCEFSVYAINKEKVNLALIDLDIDNKTIFTEFLLSTGAIKLAENIYSSITIPVSSPTKKIIHEYDLNLNQIKISPDRTSTIRSNYSYFYPIISLIALLIIITILVRRKNNGQ